MKVKVHGGTILQILKDLFSRVHNLFFYLAELMQDKCPYLYWHWDIASKAILSAIKIYQEQTMQAETRYNLTIVEIVRQ